MRNFLLTASIILALAVLAYYYADTPVAGPAKPPNDVSAPLTSEGHELVTVIKPAYGERVMSPLVVSGLARGYWFFEASFPLVLETEAGEELAVGFAMTTDGADWMTEDYVPFEGTLTFPEQPQGSKGILWLHKDNPSGMPEYDDAYALPVTF